MERTNLRRVSFKRLLDKLEREALFRASPFAKLQPTENKQDLKIIKAELNRRYRSPKKSKEQKRKRLNVRRMSFKALLDELVTLSARPREHDSMGNIIQKSDVESEIKEIKREMCRHYRNRKKSKR